MADHFLPTGRAPAEVEWRLVDLTGRFQSPLSGAVRTVSRGQRLAATYRFQNLSAAERHALIGFAAALRGGANRAILPDPTNRRRGNFPGGELLPNGLFASGTTGWVGQAATLTAVNRALRITASRGYDGSVVPQATATAAAAVQYAPHAARVLMNPGRGSMGTNGVYLEAAGIGGADYASGSGLRTRAAVLAGTSTVYAAVAGNGSTGYTAGDYAECAYASLQRCALVDGAPNLLLQSNTGSNAAWSKLGCTSSGNGGRAPDGSVSGAQDAQYILEDTSTGSHFVSQAVSGLASAATDYAFTVYVSPGVRGWCYLQMLEASGSTSVYRYFNVSTGAEGASSTGANWAHLRTFVTPVGNGWYRLSIVARKTNAATQVTCYIAAATGDGVGSYAGGGGGSAHLLWWNAVLAASSAPTRHATTTTTAAAATEQTGAGLHLKGLPASTNGLLEPGDGVEIAGERKLVTAPLNSDASGLGYLQFEPAMRIAAVDNAPVIVHDPLFRGVLVDDAAWSTRPGHFSDLTLSFIEA